MRPPVLLLGLSVAVLLCADVLAQTPVDIQFQTDPVLVQTGTQIVFTVITVPNVLSITWQYNDGVTLGLWAGQSSVINPVPQFQGRITITATQLRIGSAQLNDAGTFTAVVIPDASTNLGQNSRSVQLRVFDAISGVNLFVPRVAVEGRNISLTCTWSTGTSPEVQWGKDGATITAGSRITITGGSLVINPSRRSDAGEYTCTVSNPVSAQTATRSLTVYYGPDTPVLTKDAPKDCVGDGDVMSGKTVRLTCVAVSLPPALYSWQRDGQPVTSSQPDSGSLSVQTSSTNDSGRYTCTARNSITQGTSEQGTDLVVVDTCLDVGEVVAIVICSVILLIILIIIIVILLCRKIRAEKRRRQMETLGAQMTGSNPRPIPPDPQRNGARDLGQGLHPPLYQSNARHPAHLYTSALPLNGHANGNARQHNGHSRANSLQHNSFHNSNSNPHNGIDNPAFTNVQHANAHNPNILIHTGTAQGGVQPTAVHVNLNTQPQSAQQNNNGQIPTIHLNLNSFSTNDQQTQQESLAQPVSAPAINNTSQTQQSLTHIMSRMQSGQPAPRNPHQGDPGLQSEPGLIPTGYTHYNSNNTAQRNANTQTYQQHSETHTRTDETSRGQDTSAARRQMPWDRLRGTPAYPSDAPQRGPTSPGFTSDSTDYTTHPPIRQSRPPNTPQSQTASRHHTPSTDRRTRSRSADVRNTNSISAPRHEPVPHTQRSTQQDIRGPPGSQTAPRQEVRRSNNPQASSLMSQPATVDRSVMPQGPTTQQGLAVPQGADIRALADPNHLPQAHRAAPIQTAPQGLGAHTQPVRQEANQPRQGGSAPVHYPNAQPHSSNLTQAALQAHTVKSQTFQNRKQQTQAALMHPGPQTQTPAAAPPPPPVIPFSQFQTLPRERTQHRSPVRGPQPPRPPVNMPVAQRPHHRSNVPHHQATMPAHRHHHHPSGNGHVGAHKHPHPHGRGQGHPPHFTHPRQQQAHRGRPR